MKHLMPNVIRHFATILLAMLMVAGSVFCMCNNAAAAPMSREASSSTDHACCEKITSPAPGAPLKHTHSHDCKHCNETGQGGIAPQPVRAAVPASFEFPPIASLPLLLTSWLDSSAPFAQPVFLDARLVTQLHAGSTLLRLHCALTT